MAIKSFFHYSNERLAELQPRQGPRRHEGEAANAVGRALVYLLDRSDLEVRFEGKLARFRHEVGIDDEDPLLEQDDPEWMPGTWIYPNPLVVTSVAEWDEEAGAYLATELPSLDGESSDKT